MTSIKEAPMNRTLTSPVWSYFKVCEEDPVQAECLLCGIQMSRGGSSPNRCGTTNLRRHILYSHNMALPSVKNKGPKLANVKSPKKPLKKQSSGNPSTISKKSDKRSNKVLKNGELMKSVMLAKKITEKERVLKEEIGWPSSYPQPDPVMCIKWNKYLNNMTATLPNLLSDGKFVDVTLSCEGQSLKCHKILLAACSPYFLELLSDAVCSHPIIVFKDFRFWELQTIVSFIYCGEVNVPQSQLARILHVAEALQIKGLTKPSSIKSEVESYQESEMESLPLSPYSSDLENMEPPVVGSTKRKRKASLLNCCKNHHTDEHVKSTSKKQKVKSPIKLKPVKGKTLRESKKSPSPIKKRKRPAKSKKSVKKEVKTEDQQNLSRSSSPVSCSHLPELLPSDLPDMLSDILSSNMMEGISLPEALKVGTVDGSLPLQHFDSEKMELDEEEKPFISNGSAHDLLHLNLECKLVKDGPGES